MKKGDFTPRWIASPPAEGTFRAVLKWGASDRFVHPNHHLYEHLKSELGMSDSDFADRNHSGECALRLDTPTRLSAPEIDDLRGIFGAENVRTDDATRLRHAYGKSMLDQLRLRAMHVDNPPDAVVYPRSADDIRQLIAYCNTRKIPIVAFGGGTSVTSGVECTRGGISMDFTVHMNRIVAINDVDQTVTVQPGIIGPELEKALNQAKMTHGCPHNYTCGHFPQSFEYSSVGGWVSTRGAGQNSTHFGKIEDLVLSQKYLTPVGDIVTVNVPRKATGPDIDQVMIGSEGSFGILVEVTLKIFRHVPGSSSYFSYLFKDWNSAAAACREVMQGEFGFPSVFRLSDPEETDFALSMYGIQGSLFDRALHSFGYQKHRRCLMLGSTDGDRAWGRLIRQKIGKVASTYGALNTSGYVAKRWEHGRFADPYLRDDLGDFGIVIDTLECGVSWSRLNEVWAEVRAYCHSRPHTICMAHSSHFYPQGTNLYFIFVTRMDDIGDYVAYQAGILDVIRRHGATMSHHHGIGKMLAPWLEGQIGKDSLDVLRALKRHFDPNNILNPGGTLGLDLGEAEQRRE